MALFLIDATYELFRSHFGAPPAVTPDGAPIGAVQGLCASMIKLLRDPRLTHVAAATDHVIESFRNELFAGYKTGEGMPEELVAQFVPAEEGLAALGIVVWAMVDCEADDALATAAHRHAGEVDRVYICSPDKDLMQCIGGNVRCWDRRRDIEYDKAAVGEKFGIAPAAIPDYLALVGDAADGIPGLSGWGAKTSALMLAEFGSIDAFPDSVGDWPGGLRGTEKLRATLVAEREAVQLYRTLATLRHDVPLAESLGDLAFSGVPTARWCAFCETNGISEQVRDLGLALPQKSP